MTMFDDELSQLRNGLRGLLPARYRFRVGDRVEYEGMRQVRVTGRVIERRQKWSETWYQVRWDRGRIAWVSEDELAVEKDEKAA